ncbi:DUF1573 domain-containing protein [Saccharicrinis fermentans]|uniref:DUF1573 domain-containing protein n=1 Tax=Saccharicrinis fermentans TaxID=982 RepID=UPI0013778A2D|nr:DUF1573 domain-containing protein [Saccharicrinis fermentans]
MLAIFLLGGCHSGASKKQKMPVKNNTQVTFEKTSHVFGKVIGGETVGCYFGFTNTGKYPLLINKVDPGCGCTSVKYPQEPVLPGQKAEIEVRFDSSGFSGYQYKVIQVYANIEDKMKELVVSANVIN